MEAIQEYFSEREAGSRDEAASGKKCEELYKKVYAANRAVREKLRVEKAEDVEKIIYGMEEITKHLALKRFEQEPT